MEKRQAQNYLAGTAVVGAMVRHEESVGRLYRTYADLFPDGAAFWNGLADQKKEHAALLHAEARKIQEGRLALNAALFNIESIRPSVVFVENQAVIARRGPLTEAGALAAARTVTEQTLAAQAFNIFGEEAGAPELCALFREMHAREQRQLEAIIQQIGDLAPGYGRLFGRLFGGK